MIENCESSVVPHEYAEFSTRFEAAFTDLPFHTESQSITMARQTAWQAYIEARKVLVTQPAPMGNCDPDYFL